MTKNHLLELLVASKTAATGRVSLKDYLIDQYVTHRYSLDAIAADLEIGIKKLREILDEYGIEKPLLSIPITLREAKRLGPDQIAKAHNVSRATAWRWKRTLIAQAEESDDAKS